MSKVERIELFHVDIPLSKPFFPSWIPGYPMTVNRFTLIRLFDTDGNVGHGAGSAFAHERQGVGELLGGFLLGIEVGDMQTVRERLREGSYLGWRNWWIESAFWELWAKQKCVPVYKLLSGSNQDVHMADVYASSGEVRDFHDRLPYLDDIREKGFDAVKIRVHSADEQKDMEIIELVREEVGDDFKIAVDANQGWPVSLIDKTPLWDLDRAIRFGKFCDDLNIAWIEEPLDMHDYAGYAKLRKAVRTKIAGCELHGDISELRTMIEHEGMDKYQPDATFSGLTAAKYVMDQCEARGLDFSPHTWTNGIGFLVNLHAFAAWKNRTLLEYPYEPPGWIPRHRDGIIEPIQVNVDGTVDVPQTPGFGITIDKKLLAKYGTRFAVITPFKLAVKTIREKGIRTTLEILKKKKAK